METILLFLLQCQFRSVLDSLVKNKKYRISHSFITHAFSLLHSIQTVLRISLPSPPLHRIIMLHTSHHNNSVNHQMVFGLFTRITVGVIEVIIRTPTALHIADAPYRKALVARYFCSRSSNWWRLNPFWLGIYLPLQRRILTSKPLSRIFNHNKKRKIFIPLFLLFITSPVSVSATTLKNDYCNKAIIVANFVPSPPSLTFFFVLMLTVLQCTASYSTNPVSLNLHFICLRIHTFAKQLSRTLIYQALLYQVLHHLVKFKEPHHLLLNGPMTQWTP